MTHIELRRESDGRHRERERERERVSEREGERKGRESDIYMYID